MKENQNKETAPENFWQKLKREKAGEPIIVLAPMADVTDAAFRRVIAKHGKPDVTWTEFVSADGLFLGGKEALMKDLIFTEAERPIVAQFFTSKPEMMKKAAALARELGFDGIDINMGCPDKSIEHQGAGAALIKTPKLAREIIRAAKEGAVGVDGQPDLPVSVKTRIGFNKNELDTWLRELLAEDPAVITVHARTRKEMSKVPARWEEVKRAVEIRNKIRDTMPAGTPGSQTLIFGNGDVMSVEESREKARQTGADGVMLGRAIFGNPWLFSSLGTGTSGDDQQTISTTPISMQEKLHVMVEHTKLFEELLSRTGPQGGTPGAKNFAIMKKHYKAYVNGWDGAKEFRMKLMEAKNADEVASMIKEYLEVK